MKADVKLTQKDLFTFLMYHMYMRPTGLIYLLVGLCSLVGGIWFLVKGNTSGIFLLLVSAVYFILQPVMLYIRAGQQVKQPILQKETHYELTEAGIRVWQEDTDVSTLDWARIRRFVRFGGEYLLYLDDIHANIIPEKDFSAPTEEINAFAAKMLPKKNRRGVK